LKSQIKEAEEISKVVSS